MTGIYLLTNTTTGHKYVGQSVDIHKRWIDHKTPSKRSRGLVLGRALSKHGAKNFKLTILEECSVEQLNDRETYWISKIHPEYNMNSGGIGNKSHFVSEETRKVISIKCRRHWEELPIDEKKRIIARLSGPPKGHAVTTETRQKLRESALKQFQGGMREEVKSKISAAHKGKPKGYASRKTPVCQIDPTTGSIIASFEYAKDAALAVGIHASGITSTCKGRQSTAAGYIWHYTHSVETIPQGSRVGDELPPEAQGICKSTDDDIVHSMAMAKSWDRDRGFIQLAIRSGQYRYLNADCIYDGEEVHRDRLTGETTISGTRTGGSVIGYFAFFETLNGFRKCLCWTREEVTAHAKRFSKSFEGKSSPWQTDFDAMAIKTVLKALLSKYGMLSIDMIRAMGDDDYDRREAQAEATIAEHANKQILNAEWQEPEPADEPPSIPPEVAAQAQQQGGNGDAAAVAMEF